MITIKLTADNERLIANATTEAELRGVQELLLERIAQAKAVKAASKAAIAEPKDPSPYNWREVVAAMRDAFGADNILCPDKPDPIWYTSMQRYAKMHQLDTARIANLASAVSESYLKPPYRAQWLAFNADAILAGKYQKGQKMPMPGRYGPDYSAASRTPLLLPED